jgi:hypothetical protein
MKKLNIILSVVLFTCTTVLLTVLPVAVSLDLGQWAVLACLILMGYTGAYLYFDNYVDFIVREQRQDIGKSWREGHDRGYDFGYYDGYRKGCKDILNKED